MPGKVLASLARIADFESVPYDRCELDRSEWETGDYIEALVTGEPSPLYKIETISGEMVQVEAGDTVVGALGNRAATLEGVGSWADVENGRMHCMTSAGLLGAFTSVSTFLPRPMSLDYRGHIVRGGRKVRMPDFALRTSHERFAVPTILMVGTSMSAGKTTTGCLVIRELAAIGRRVFGAKLTGAGRYRDVLCFRRAGAFGIADFVDAGLPSTVVDEQTFREAVRPLLCYIDERKPDFLVAEAGASPLEPYNGEAAIDELGANIRCTILCASDPYAVLGVERAFGLTPDLVSGPATNTSAGRDLVRRLTGVEAVDIADSDALVRFRAVLTATLGVKFG